MTSALHEEIVVELQVVPAPGAERRDLVADLESFVAGLRRARFRLGELTAMLEDERRDPDLVVGVERAANRIYDGVLAQARSAAEALIDGAVIGRQPRHDVGSGGTLARDDSALARHRDVVELQRGVEELSAAISGLVAERRVDPPGRPTLVRKPPDDWTFADTFAERYR